MNREDFINQLANDLPEKTKVVTLNSLLLSWGIISVAFLALSIYWLGVSENIAYILSEPLLAFEALCSLTLGVLSAAGAFIASIPGRTKTKTLKYLALFPLALWIMTVSIRWLVLKETAPNLLGPLHCSWYIVFLSIIPGIFIFHLLRKAAPLELGPTGFLAFTCVIGFGAFVMGLGCTLHDPLHIAATHILPVLVLGLAGGLLGKKLLN